MQTSKTPSHKVRLRPEIFILIAIILLLTLICGHHDTINNSAISINANGQISLLSGKDNINQSKNNKIPTFEFQYGTCYFIEIQNENGLITDQISFSDEINAYEYLLADSNVIESINNKDQSQINTTIDGINLIIYSTWVECSNNRYLVQYIINDNKVKEFFIFKLLFHGVIILCYLMLLRTIYFQIKGTSNRYERSIQKLYSNTN